MPERLQEIGTWLAGISAAIAITVKGIKSMWAIGSNIKRILDLAEANDRRMKSIDREIDLILHRLRAIDGGPGEVSANYATPEGAPI